MDPGDTDSVVTRGLELQVNGTFRARDLEAAEATGLDAFVGRSLADEVTVDIEEGHAGQSPPRLKLSSPGTWTPAPMRTVDFSTWGGGKKEVRAGMEAIPPIPTPMILRMVFPTTAIVAMGVVFRVLK